MASRSQSRNVRAMAWCLEIILRQSSQVSKWRVTVFLRCGPISLLAKRARERSVGWAASADRPITAGDLVCGELCMTIGEATQLPRQRCLKSLPKRLITRENPQITQVGSV